MNADNDKRKKKWRRSSENGRPLTVRPLGAQRLSFPSQGLFKQARTVFHSVVVASHCQGKKKNNKVPGREAGLSQNSPATKDKTGKSKPNGNQLGTSRFFWRNCSPRRSRAIVLSSAGLTFLVFFFFFCRFALTRYASARTHQQNHTPHKKVGNSRTREKGAFRWVRGRAR